MEVDCSTGQFKSAKLKDIRYKRTKFLHNNVKQKALIVIVITQVNHKDTLGIIKDRRIDTNVYSQ